MVYFSDPLCSSGATPSTAALQSSAVDGGGCDGEQDVAGSCAGTVIVVLAENRHPTNGGIRETRQAGCCRPHAVVAEVAPRGRSVSARVRSKERTALPNEGSRGGHDQEQATNDARRAGNARDALPHPTRNATLFYRKPGSLRLSGKARRTPADGRSRFGGEGVGHNARHARSQFVQPARSSLNFQGVLRRRDPGGG